MKAKVRESFKKRTLFDNVTATQRSHKRSDLINVY